MKRLTVVFMAVAAFLLFAAGAAQAGPPAEKATGSIVMSNPKQAISFAAFEGQTKGSVTYTNFEYADPGSGVWVPGATFNVDFAVDPDLAIVSTYEFTVDSVTPLSPTSLAFSGNGVQQFGPWHGAFTGAITGSTISFTLQEINGLENYTLNATGAIDAAGAVAGAWNDNYGGARTGTFSIADVGDEVFSFTTTPTCVDVDPATRVAKFGYTIPTGAPAELAGKPVAVQVNDGGSSGVYDTYKHTFASTPDSCEPNGAYWVYPITAGNLTVHG